MRRGDNLCGVRSQQPCRFLNGLGRRPRDGGEIGALEQRRSGCKQVPVVLRPPIEVPAQDLQPTVVVVTDKRRETIGTDVVVCELQHPLERRAVVRGQRMAASVGHDVDADEHLEHQAVIRERVLEMDAVGRDLISHAFDGSAESNVEPLSRLREVAERRSQADQARVVRDRVIRRHTARVAL